MTEAPRPTLHAVVQAAVEATGSAGGWLLKATGDQLKVVAAHGHPDAAGTVGATRELTGTAAFVLASGQPAAMQVQPGDADNNGAGGGAGVPSALLAVPCGSADVVGVIEVVDPEGGAYSFDDVEMVSVLGDVAGAALEEDQSEATAPSPTELAEGLRRLAVADAVRYAAVAQAVEALL